MWCLWLPIQLPHVWSQLRNKPFVTHILWSDQGPQFTSHVFQAFTAEWGFKHMTSTPTYPQSNGKIEAMVKSVKKIIQASWMGSYLDDGNWHVPFCSTATLHVGRMSTKGVWSSHSRHDSSPPQGLCTGMATEHQGD